MEGNNGSGRWYREQQRKEVRREQSIKMKSEHLERHRHNFELFTGWKGKEFFENGQIRKPFPKNGRIFERKK